ncbi:uncharacterized protein BDV14DRAFT_179171 [Aspergillus stella-maris]|uniref:uncharacterized protein n=1 Tax=Aspergillus stella-maris TaxID=1810926 RepID=UPI003CCD5694
MKFTAASILALLATSASAASLLPRQSTRTVVFTNEQSGRGQAANIPTNGVDVSVPANYPQLFNPFHVDSVMITSGVVSGALCKVHGTNAAGARVDVLQVNGERNYARFPQDTGVVPSTLKINCV